MNTKRLKSSNKNTSNTNTSKNIKNKNSSKQNRAIQVQRNAKDSNENNTTTLLTITKNSKKDSNSTLSQRKSNNTNPLATSSRIKRSLKPRNEQIDDDYIIDAWDDDDIFGPSSSPSAKPPIKNILDEVTNDTFESEIYDDFDFGTYGHFDAFTNTNNHLKPSKSKKSITTTTSMTTLSSSSLAFQPRQLAQQPQSTSLSYQPRHLAQQRKSEQAQNNELVLTDNTTSRKPTNISSQSSRRGYSGAIIIATTFKSCIKQLRKRESINPRDEEEKITRARMKKMAQLNQTDKLNKYRQALVAISNKENTHYKSDNSNESSLVGLSGGPRSLSYGKNSTKLNESKTVYRFGNKNKALSDEDAARRFRNRLAKGMKKHLNKGRLAEYNGIVLGSSKHILAQCSELHRYQDDIREERKERQEVEYIFSFINDNGRNDDNVNRYMLTNKAGTKNLRLEINHAINTSTASLPFYNENDFKVLE